MRTVLSLSMLILAFCVGCQQPVPELNNYEPKDIVVPLDTDRPEPLIEPLVPRVAPPADTTPPEEGTPSEAAPAESTGIVSEVFGKYAAEAVPLPPVEDLTTQIDEYITKMGEALELLDGSPRYASDASDIVRDSNALALVAHAVGLAEADSEYKKSAPQIVASAQNLAAAKNLEEGQKSYAALKESLAGVGRGQSLAWSDKVASLTAAMKALPNLSSTVKRVTDTPRKLNTILDRRSQQIFGQTAAMAVIAQGAIPNVAETPKPDAVAEWKKYCEEFRDAAIKVNAVTRQHAKDRAEEKDPDYAIFNNAFKAMSESCDNCHKVFYPQAVGKE